jgi:hypothetical protein
LMRWIRTVWRPLRLKLPKMKELLHKRRPNASQVVMSIVYHHHSTFRAWNTHMGTGTVDHVVLRYGRRTYSLPAVSGTSIL